MKPERGDESAHVLREDVARALMDTGVVPGDIVMFHSSLSSMGHVAGGPQTVIDGMLDAVGPGGTVAAPTLCQKEKDRRFETWDIERSPSDVGAITEALRLRPDSIRSDHPTHSVAAIGTRAEELMSAHRTTGGRPGPWGDRAFAKDSPWDYFYRWNAHHLFIGVDYRVNTMRHYIQSLLVERALARAPAPRRDESRERVKGWLKPGVWPDYSPLRMQLHLESLGLFRLGNIGSATLRHIRARPMVDRELEAFETEPERWFQADFLEWLDELRGMRR